MTRPPGSGGRGPDSSGAPDDLELAEVRRRKKEAIEEERRRRAADVPDDVPPPPSDAPRVAWIPPREMRGGPRSRLLPRLLFFALLLAVGFVLARTLIDRVLTPDLQVEEASVPDGVVAPDEPATFGVAVSNRSRSAGEALAVLVVEDLLELEGRPVALPPRSTTTVPVEAALPAGDHVVSLLVYDTWREDRRVGAFHGIPVRVGEPELDVVEASLGAVDAGADSVEVIADLANRTDRNERVTLVVVFQRTDEEAPPVEVHGPDLAIAGGESTRASFLVGVEDLPPVPFLVSVLAITARGDRAGAGVHGIPFQAENVP